MASKNRPREGRRKRGFAAMDPEAQREISKRGGEASHESGRGHKFSSEEAREAGRRGGEARWGSRPGRRESPEGNPGRGDSRSGAAEPVETSFGPSEERAPEEEKLLGELGRRGLPASALREQREAARPAGEAPSRSRAGHSR